MRLRRLLGVPFLVTVAGSSVGFSIYFSLGVVADRGLGLTPVVFLVVGLLFAITTMTYVEGGAMFLERGGSSMFARHAFNELVSFIAGWAILIDYLIVIAAAAISVPHYLSPISESFREGDVEVVVAAAVIALTVVLNIAGFTGKLHERRLVLLSLIDLVMLLVVIGVGLFVVLEPSLLTAELNLFTSPSGEDLIAAAVVATVAFAGIEAASDLAPDLEFEPLELRRVLSAAVLLVPLLYAGIAAIALMAVPVEPTPDGPETALGDEFVEAPVLGIVQSFDPDWLADVMQWAVLAVAVPVLVWAANVSMLGLSRHTYVLAMNRQIPSWLGKLQTARSTPYVAIILAGLLSLGLALPSDIKFLAAVYAFGALLAITIAHASVIRLRRTQPDLERPYRVPLTVGRIPVPALVGAVASALGWIGVFVVHGPALYVGGGWMLFGLVSYFIYRRYVEGTSLTRQVSVPEMALKKQAPAPEFSSILVPVFGTELDDDIVSTAGRIADAEVEEGEMNPKLEVIFVPEMPLTVPLNAPLPPPLRELADRTLERASEIGDEYENVDVATAVVPARNAGAGIVEEARRSGAEVIVMGAEPPTKVRGGAILGGIGAARPEEIGKVTEYVLRKAPCRVLLTAPADEQIEEEMQEDDHVAEGG